jgi:hypothetical protein
MRSFKTGTAASRTNGWPRATEAFATGRVLHACRVPVPGRKVVIWGTRAAGEPTTDKTRRPLGMVKNSYTGALGQSAPVGETDHSAILDARASLTLAAAEDEQSRHAADVGPRPQCTRRDRRWRYSRASRLRPNTASKSSGDTANTAYDAGSLRVADTRPSRALAYSLLPRGHGPTSSPFPSDLSAALASC